jgi:hypothetical protein
MFPRRHTLLLLMRSPVWSIDVLSALPVYPELIPPFGQGLVVRSRTGSRLATPSRVGSGLVEMSRSGSRLVRQSRSQGE